MHVNEDPYMPNLTEGKARLHAGLLVGVTVLLSSCSAPGILNGLSGLFPGDNGARRVVSGAAFGADRRQKLDVWAPRGADRKARLPVVIFFYGGGWVAGSRGDYGFAGAAYAGRGFVTIIPDYRLVPNVRFPAFVEDGALAVRWARDHVAEYGGDPERISLAGHSAGAYNAAMLSLDEHFLREAGVDPKIVRAAALLAGPYDFYPFTDRRARDALGQWPRPGETQPIRFARTDAPPLWLAAGSADQVVMPGNSKRLAERLTDLGAPVELRVYAGATHNGLAKSLSRPFRRTTSVLSDSAVFLEANSRPDRTN